MMVLFKLEFSYLINLIALFSGSKLRLDLVNDISSSIFFQRFTRNSIPLCFWASGLVNPVHPWLEETEGPQIGITKLVTYTRAILDG